MTTTPDRIWALPGIQGDDICGTVLPYEVKGAVVYVRADIAAEREIEIDSLRQQLAAANAELAATKEERDFWGHNHNDLQQKLREARAELAQSKADALTLANAASVNEPQDRDALAAAVIRVRFGRHEDGMAIQMGTYHDCQTVMQKHADANAELAQFKQLIDDHEGYPAHEVADLCDMLARSADTMTANSYTEIASIARRGSSAIRHLIGELARPREPVGDEAMVEKVTIAVLAASDECSAEEAARVLAKWRSSPSEEVLEVAADQRRIGREVLEFIAPLIRAQERERAAKDALRGSDTRVGFYEREFYPLSNFSSFELEWRGFRFATSEHAYHWFKFSGDLPIQEVILSTISAHDAFRLAQKYKSRRHPDWDQVKIDVMRDILKAKVEQHEYVRRKLLETGERELVEDSWRDDFWGIGPNGDGKNMLGKLWMEVRSAIRAGDAP